MEPYSTDGGFKSQLKATTAKSRLHTDQRDRAIISNELGVNRVRTLKAVTTGISGTLEPNMHLRKETVTSSCPVGRAEEIQHPLSPAYFKGLPYTKLYAEDQKKQKKNMKDQFVSGCTTDLKIVCHDGHFFVHRAVLVPASDFVHSLLEGHEGEKVVQVLFPDYKLESVKRVVCAFYHGYIPLYDNVCETEIDEVITLFGLKNLVLIQLREQGKDEPLVGYAYSTSDKYPLLIPPCKNKGEVHQRSEAPSTSVTILENNQANQPLPSSSKGIEIDEPQGAVEIPMKHIRKKKQKLGSKKSSKIDEEACETERSEALALDPVAKQQPGTSHSNKLPKEHVSDMPELLIVEKWKKPGPRLLTKIVRKVMVGGRKTGLKPLSTSTSTIPLTIGASQLSTSHPVNGNSERKNKIKKTGKLGDLKDYRSVCEFKKVHRQPIPTKQIRVTERNTNFNEINVVATSEAGDDLNSDQMTSSNIFSSENENQVQESGKRKTITSEADAKPPQKKSKYSEEGAMDVENEVSNTSESNLNGDKNSEAISRECYFCSVITTSAKAFEDHLKASGCGSHLKGWYSLRQGKCHICDQVLPPYSWKLLRHVNKCHAEKNHLEEDAVDGPPGNVSSSLSNEEIEKNSGNEDIEIDSDDIGISESEIEVDNSQDEIFKITESQIVLHVMSQEFLEKSTSPRKIAPIGENATPPHPSRIVKACPKSKKVLNEPIETNGETVLTLGIPEAVTTAQISDLGQRDASPHLATRRMKPCPKSKRVLYQANEITENAVLSPGILEAQTTAQMCNPSHTVSALHLATWSMKACPNSKKCLYEPMETERDTSPIETEPTPALKEIPHVITNEEAGSQPLLTSNLHLGIQSENDGARVPVTKRRQTPAKVAPNISLSVFDELTRTDSEPNTLSKIQYPNDEPPLSGTQKRQTTTNVTPNTSPVPAELARTDTEPNVQQIIQQLNDEPPLTVTQKSQAPVKVTQLISPPVPAELTRTDAEPKVQQKIHQPNDQPHIFETQKIQTPAQMAPNASPVPDELTRTSAETNIQQIIQQPNDGPPFPGTHKRQAPAKVASSSITYLPVPDELLTTITAERNLQPISQKPNDEPPLTGKQKKQAPAKVTQPTSTPVSNELIRTDSEPNIHPEIQQSNYGFHVRGILEGQALTEVVPPITSHVSHELRRTYTELYVKPEIQQSNAEPPVSETNQKQNPEVMVPPMSPRITEEFTRTFIQPNVQVEIQQSKCHPPVPVEVAQHTPLLIPGELIKTDDGIVTSTSPIETVSNDRITTTSMIVVPEVTANNDPSDYTVARSTTNEKPMDENLISTDGEREPRSLNAEIQPTYDESPASEKEAKPSLDPPSPIPGGFIRMGEGFQCTSCTILFDNMTEFDDHLCFIF